MSCSASSAGDHRRWPGKTLHPVPDGPGWHPATFHCLDVAAVAERLLLSNTAWCRRLAGTLNADEDATRRLLTRLVAVHDIGKLSRGFCEMLGHALPVTSCHAASRSRHWQCSYDLMIDPLDEPMARLLGVGRSGARRQLYAAVAGHHGRPPEPSPRFEDFDGVADATRFIEELGELIEGEDAWFLDAAVAKRLSWSLAGLTVLADWIGSNSSWFPYADSDIPTADYWERARRQAGKAVDRAGAGGAVPAASSSANALFGIDMPRPMQKAVVELDIGTHPMMAVIEDATGSGKTEAAILLAQRMMAAGLGEGIYVALPTMATASAMFGRLGESYRGLFDAGAHPSLALAHSGRAHDQRFADAVAAGLAFEEVRDAGSARNTSIDETDVSSFCASWIADDRRKTFIAEVGVGTIDQAFLSVLPVRFSVLRLIGLARRILIVDEAHACDPYMEVELCRLLEMQATLGGSAIIMTATLTASLREKLVASYRAGIGVESNDFRPVAPYPSLTVARINREACRDIAVTAGEHSVRTLPIQRLASIDEVVSLIVGAARRGAAIAWIRNTVDDVIAGHDLLLAAEVQVELFHARFAMGDRLDIENGVLERFGVESTPDERCGRVLVASQVIESSLDLDFDVMVSDLAPVDALIQRAGRLWRHKHVRPDRQRPVAGPILHVLSPDPDHVEGSSWGREQFGNSGFVYGTSLLWRSARALFDAGVIDAPDGLRDLLEAVVGKNLPEVPAPLDHDENSLIGKEYADAARSSANAVEPSAGYLALHTQGTDVSFPTRADTDGCRVVLVRREEGELATFLPDDPTTALSEVGLRKYLYERLVEQGGAPADGPLPTFARGWPTWRRESLRLLEVAPDDTIGRGARYDRRRGLQSVPEQV